MTAMPIAHNPNAAQRYLAAHRRYLKFEREVLCGEDPPEAANEEGQKLLADEMHWQDRILADPTDFRGRSMIILLAAGIELPRGGVKELPGRVQVRQDPGWWEQWKPAAQQAALDLATAILRRGEGRVVTKLPRSPGRSAQ